jgi:hypothetical protein
MTFSRIVTRNLMAFVFFGGALYLLTHGFYVSGGFCLLVSAAAAGNN